MRPLLWLSGCLLLLSCSLNSDNLTTPPADGGGSGGAGGCPRCVPTGGTTGSGGGLGSGGVVATGGVVGTGGAVGTGGDRGTGTGGDKGKNDGGESCGQLESDYGVALTDAKACTPGAANQCQEPVNSSLSCPGCKQYVNDSTMLEAIAAAWDAANCGATPHACPAIACVLPTQGVCASTSPNNGPNAGASPGGSCTNGAILSN